MVKTAGIVTAMLSALLAGCSIGHDAEVTASNPLSFAGQTYFTCQDKIAKVQGFEAQGLDKVQPKTRAELATYADYVIAMDNLYLNPQCHQHPGDGGFYWGTARDVQQSGQFLSALTATVPPDFQKYGKSGEDIYVNALNYGTPASEMTRLLHDGSIERMVAKREVHATAKAALDKTGWF